MQGRDLGAGAIVRPGQRRQSRERRAKDKAIANWGKRARDTYGWQYRFWTKSEEQKVECGGTAKAKHCSVSAKPCTLF